MFQEVTKSQSKPVKSLTEPKKRSGGRNNNGRLTSRHIGGGHKQKYRKVDFKRRKRGIMAEVMAIEYDPNRTARIALIKYSDGEQSYILAPDGLAGRRQGDGGRRRAARTSATRFRSARFR